MNKLLAKCIIDGYMEEGDLFCKEGETYSYEMIKDRKYPIKMETIASKEHIMDWDFFYEHFVKLEEADTFSEKDFEI